MSRNNPFDGHLTVDAHVVTQLGEELISDPEQAILELVKNSYDADAEWCVVNVNTEYLEDEAEKFLAPSESQASQLSESARKSLAGRIIVEDNGSGMDIETIKRGWLTISRSYKRDFKVQKRVTPKFKRTPLGDKGLGRLSTMKLGDLLRITTFVNENENGHQISFQWSDCKSGIAIEDVNINYTEVASTGKTGTKIEIIGLNDLSYWKGNTSRKRLQNKISSLISPFEAYRNFQAILTVDDHPIDLHRLTSKVLKKAITEFSCAWEQSKLNMLGQVKIDLFGKDKEERNKYLKSDGGRGFYNFLRNRSEVNKFSAFTLNDNEWFLRFEESIDWTDIPRSETLDNPGNFHAKIYSFSYDSEFYDKNAVIGDVSKELIQELSGISIFRDGFQVRAGEDWLKLSHAATSGGSWYALRPKNVLGFFAISGKDNSLLVEKSDREGFVDNYAWQGFFILGTKFRDFANNALEIFRRAFNDYVKQKRKEEEDLPDSFSAEQGADEIKSIIHSTEQLKKQLERSNKDTSERLKSIKNDLDQALDNILLDDLSRQRLNELEKRLKELETKILNHNSLYKEFVEKVGKHRLSIDLVMEKFEQLKHSIADVYSNAAVGLSAHGIAHEVHPLLDEIILRLNSVESYLNSKNLNDPVIKKDLNAIKSFARLIGKNISFLNPMLKAFRETKEKILLPQFLTEYFDIRGKRFKELGIRHVAHGTNTSLTIRINQGRLTQVIDNLIRNSEYWLLHAKSHQEDLPLEIHTEIRGDKLLVWDTGLGIRPAMESILFDLFVSDKPKDEGQGLGLFITRQLLEAEDCDIDLCADRNNHGRRYKFEICFKGVVNG